MDIRKFRDEDSEEKKSVHLRSIREVASDYYSEDQIEAWSNFDDHGDVPEENSERWVALKDDEVVGFADYRFDKGRVTGVYVHPDHLREGIAAKLLEKVVQNAKARNLDELRAESSVAAKEFYQSQGFQFEGETTHETSGEELKAFEMVKELE